jgi:hypothetical protein
VPLSPLAFDSHALDEHRRPAHIPSGRCGTMVTNVRPLPCLTLPSHKHGRSVLKWARAQINTLCAKPSRATNGR